MEFSTVTKLGTVSIGALALTIVVFTLPNIVFAVILSGKSRMPIIQKLEQLEKDVMALQIRMADTEAQVKRVTSHVESEVGLARTDILRIETKLFGKDDDNIYGGRIGQITEKQHKQDKQAAWISGICACIIVLFELWKALK